MITQTLINPHQLLGFVPQDVLCLTNNFHIFFLPYYSCPVNHDSSETNSNIVMTSQYGKKKNKPWEWKRQAVTVISRDVQPAWGFRLRKNPSYNVMTPKTLGYVCLTAFNASNLKKQRGCRLRYEHSKLWQVHKNRFNCLERSSASWLSSLKGGHLPCPCQWHKGKQGLG